MARRGLLDVYLAMARFLGLVVYTIVARLRLLGVYLAMARLC